MEKANFKDKFKKFALIFKVRFSGTQMNTTSAAICYYLLLSLFPLVIAIGNLLPFFNIDPTGILGYMDTVVPAAVLPVLRPLVENVLTLGSGGLLSIGLIAAIWSSSKGINHLQRGVNKAYGITDSGSFIVKRLFSVLVILLILVLLLVFVLVFSFGEMFLEALGPRVAWAHRLFGWLIDLKWPVSLGFLFCLLLLVYRVTPDVKLKLRNAVPGAAFATVGLLVLVQAFAVYVRFSTRTWSSYGVLSSVFVLMFWLNFSMTIVLTGAVLNASISEYRFGHAVEEHSSVDVAINKTRQNLAHRLVEWRAKRQEKKKDRDRAKGEEKEASKEEENK